MQPTLNFGKMAISLSLSRPFSLALLLYWSIEILVENNFFAKDSDIKFNDLNFIYPLLRQIWRSLYDINGNQIGRISIWKIKSKKKVN